MPTATTDFFSILCVGFTAVGENQMSATSNQDQSADRAAL